MSKDRRSGNELYVASQGLDGIVEWEEIFNRRRTAIRIGCEDQREGREPLCEGALLELERALAQLDAGEIPDLLSPARLERGGKHHSLDQHQCIIDMVRYMRACQIGYIREPDGSFISNYYARVLRWINAAHGAKAGGVTAKTLRKWLEDDRFQSVGTTYELRGRWHTYGRGLIEVMAKKSAEQYYSLSRWAAGPSDP